MFSAKLTDLNFNSSFNPSSKDEDLSKTKAATLCQSLFRRKQAVANYHIGQLPNKSLQDWTACILGNDPQDERIEKLKMEKDDLVLLGAGGLRSVWLACDLNSPVSKHSPKIIIMDISIKVAQFWKNLRKFASQNDTKEQFLDNIEEFVLNQTLIACCVDKTAVIYSQFNNYFRKFGFDFVRDIILNATYLKQNWLTQKNFKVIKNVLDLTGKADNLVVYASNIIPCCSRFNPESIIANILILKPKLMIHSNLNLKTCQASELYLTTEIDKTALMNIIFPNGFEVFLKEINRIVSEQAKSAEQAKSEVAQDDDEVVESENVVVESEEVVVHDEIVEV